MTDPSPNQPGKGVPDKTTESHGTRMQGRGAVLEGLKVQPVSPRARSMRHPWPFRISACLTALFFLWVLATATSLVCLLVYRSPIARDMLLGGFAVSLILWLVTLFRRRSVLCPLCRGTPLLNSPARVHARAFRIWPFNHGNTAILSILARQKFRCMYCGTDFDLLKSASHLRNRDSTGPSTHKH